MTKVRQEPVQKRLSEKLIAAHTAMGTSDLPAARSSPSEETRGCCFSTQQQLLCQHAPLRSPVPKALRSPATTSTRSHNLLSFLQPGAVAFGSPANKSPLQ